MKIKTLTPAIVGILALTLLIVHGQPKASFNMGLPAYVAALSTDTTFYNVPEFYNPRVVISRDTQYRFECYNRQFTLLNDVSDFDSVYYLTLYKNYTDSTHTYKDSDGSRKYLPVSLIYKRYDRQGRNKWVCIEYPSNKYTSLLADKQTIVKEEFIGQCFIGRICYFRYYKVTPVRY